MFPLIFSCPIDRVPEWRPRILLGMVEARSVNMGVKNTETQTRKPGYGERAADVGRGRKNLSREVNLKYRQHSRH